MSQLVGSDCVVCGERISSILNAEHCNACGAPVHFDCRETCEGRQTCGTCDASTAEDVEIDDGDSPTSPPVDRRGPSGEQFELSRLLLPSGRAGRLEYFLQGSFSFPAACVLFVVIDESVGGILSECAWLLFVLAFWSVTVVTIRRLHDLDRPGWHWFLQLVPLYNIYFCLMLLLEVSQPKILNPGQELLVEANHAEMKGEWQRAFELYEQAAEHLTGTQDGEYAINCIKHLQEKSELGRRAEGDLE